MTIGRTNSEQCIVCRKDVADDAKRPLCRFHMEAYNNIIENYDKWRSAYGNLTPEEFLKRLKDNEYTGKWIKEVVLTLLSQRDLLRAFLDDLFFQDKKD